MRVPGQAPRPAAVPRHPSARTYATPSTCSDASDPHVAPLQSGMTLMARRPRLPEVRSIAASIGCVPVDRAFLSYRAQRGRSRPPRPHSIARRRHSDLATSHMVRDQRRKCPADSGVPSSRRVVRQLALGPAEVLMGAGTPAKVPRKFWGTEFWESTGQTPGESAPQILGHRGLGPRTPNPTG